MGELIGLLSRFTERVFAGELMIWPKFVAEKMDEQRRSGVPPEDWFRESGLDDQ